MNGNIATAFRTENTTIVSIVLPAVTFKAMSQDLMYFVGNDTLYGFNKTTFQFDPLKNFSQNARYTIKNYLDRIIVWGMNTRTVQSGGGLFNLSTNASIYVFHRKYTGFVEIGKVMVYNHLDNNAASNQSLFMVLVSPHLSKFGFSQLTTTGFKVRARNVDFNQDVMYNLTFSDPVHYTATVAFINPLTEIDFNDFYMVIRNGTMVDWTNDTEIAAKNPV